VRTSTGGRWVEQGLDERAAGVSISFERGRYARVKYQGDGAEHAYRVELWADRDSYVVRPWPIGIDD
jgi:hypothetical protein